MKYLFIKADDAALLLGVLIHVRGQNRDAFKKIEDRLRDDTGGDIDAIVADLKATEACPACVIEGQERSCCAWDTQRIGRRLARLVARANGGAS